MNFLTAIPDLFGRLHPMMLHIPIGVLIGLGIVELVNLKRGLAPASKWFLCIGAIGAIVVAWSGWVLHHEDSYANSFVLRWHERLGIATAVGATLCTSLRFMNHTKLYRITLFLTLGIMIPAGHFGSEMTHGKGFLLEPFEENVETYEPMQAPSSEVDTPTMASYERNIAPMLEARCMKCHGPRKSKGDLRLDSIDAILAGGENGAIIQFAIAADGSRGEISVEESEIYRRLLLPIEHDDHMPPESKTQLNAVEVELLQLWLAAGAPFENDFALGDGVELPSTPVADADDITLEDVSEQVEQAVDPAYLSAIEKLRANLVHVQPIEPGSLLLWVDFAAVAENTDDTMVQDLLFPLAESISELSLARSLLTNDSLEFLAGMPNLTKLSLGQTTVDDSGLALFAGHPKLQQLRVQQTQITVNSFSVFQNLPALTGLWIWETDIAEGAVDLLRIELPNTTINSGDSFQAEPLEVEPDLVFTSDAPLLDTPKEADASAAGVQQSAAEESSVSLIAGNTECPVSGKPVDPRYIVVYDGKMIGFCCPNCPKTFWEDPAKYQ